MPVSSSTSTSAPWAAYIQKDAGFRPMPDSASAGEDGSGV